MVTLWNILKFVATFVSGVTKLFGFLVARPSLSLAIATGAYLIGGLLPQESPWRRAFYTVSFFAGLPAIAAFVPWLLSIWPSVPPGPAAWAPRTQIQRFRRSAVKHFVAPYGRSPLWYFYPW